MPGFNRWLNGKNRQINRQKRVFGTPTANYADPAGEEIGQEAMRGMNTGRPKSGGGGGFSVRPGWRGGLRGGPTVTGRYRFG